MHGVTGTLSVPGVVLDGACSHLGNEGYDDIDPGTNIVVLDENSVTIAAGELGQVEPIAAGHDAAPCVFDFSLDVPKAAFYHVKIGRRDGPTDSFATMEAADWTWDLTLGS